MSNALKTITVEVGLPDPCLSPNSRAHWAKVATAKKTLREAVYQTVKFTQPLAASQRWEHGAVISYAFHHTTRRVRDDDNFIAMMKAGRDAFSPTRVTKRGQVIPGLSIVPDDNLITQGPISFHVSKDAPRVVITLLRKEA